MPVFLTILLISFLVYQFNVFLFSEAPIAYEYSKRTKVILFFVNNTIAVMLYWSYFKTCLTDAGRVPVRLVSETDSDGI